MCRSSHNGTAGMETYRHGLGDHYAKRSSIARSDVTRELWKSADAGAVVAVLVLVLLILSVGRPTLPHKTREEWGNQ